MTVHLLIGERELRVDLPAGVTAVGATATSSPTIDTSFTAAIDGAPISADARLLEPDVLSLIVDGRQYRCVRDGDAVLVDGQRFPFELRDPRSLQARRGKGAGANGPREVKAPMPGRVVRVLVQEGDTVEEQQGLVVIEAMKMQNELKSPRAGRVARVPAKVGETVQSGDILAVVE